MISEVDECCLCRFAVLNDFEAVGYGVSVVPDSDLLVLNDAPVDPKVSYPWSHHPCHPVWSRSLFDHTLTPQTWLVTAVKEVFLLRFQMSFA